MQKVYLFYILLLFSTLRLNGQFLTGISYDFSEQTSLGWDTISGYGNPGDTTYIEEETAVFVMDNSEQFRVYGHKLSNPINISSNRYLSFRYHCKANIVVQVATNDTLGVFGCGPSIQLNPTDTFRTVYISFNCTSESNFGAVDSLFFVLVNMNLENNRDTFFLDDLALGSDVHLPASEITGFTEDFDDNSLSPAWVHYGSDTSYLLTETNQELQTLVNKNNWEGLLFNFPKLMDMSENPNVSLRIKSKTAVPFRVYIMDYMGAYNTWNGVYHDNEWNVNVAGDSTYREYCFNFAGHFVQHFWNGMPSVPIDSTRIASIMFCVNPEFSFTDSIWIDDVRIGDQASTLINHAPTINQVAGMMIDSTSGLQTIQLTGISTGDVGFDTLSISAKCKPTKYITTPQITYNQWDENATLSFTIKRAGTTLVTLTLADNGTDYTNLGTATTQIQFEVIVNSLTGTTEILRTPSFKLYPNPATELLNIEASGNNIVEARIIDQTGRVVLVQNPGSDKLAVDIHSFPRGIYLVELKSNSTVIRKRFLKQ